MSNEAMKHGGLRMVLTTWIFELHAAGVQADDPEVTRLCTELAEAAEEGAGEKAAEALLERVTGLLEGREPAQVIALARRLYGDRVATDMGEGERQDRAARIRRYQFGSSLPWLARVWERFDDGQVAPSWLLVERLTEAVEVMDPDPWNDRDDERNIPTADFQVLWELDGCTSIYLS